MLLPTTRTRPDAPGFGHRLAFRLGTRRVCQGIPCSAASGEGRVDSAILDRLEAALDLIRAHEPRRLRRLAADVRRILVAGKETAYGGTMFRDSGWCVFTVPYVTNAHMTVRTLACALVHEATHARLTICRGLRDPRRRIREERLCMRQERAFATLLPDGDTTVAWLDRELARPDAEWAEAFRHQDDWHRAMKDNGVPKWLRRALSWLRRMRAA